MALPLLFEIANFIVFHHAGRIFTHNIKLANYLKKDDSQTILEQTVIDVSLKSINEKIDKILPGIFEFSSNGDYYVHNGIKLKVVNLATGSKMFSIIKILLQKGELDKSTVLILDEPEAHLHPQWQNAFAEIIVLFVKELGVHVLLTTHSPNFMLAIDANMRKYGISNITNFYQSVQRDDGFVDYKCVNDDMGLIYQDFMQYLSEVKVLRDKYIGYTEE